VRCATAADSAGLSLTHTRDCADLPWLSDQKVRSGKLSNYVDTGAMSAVKGRSK